MSLLTADPNVENSVSTRSKKAIIVDGMKNVHFEQDEKS